MNIFLYMWYSICIDVDYFLLFFLMIKVLGWKSKLKHPWIMWALFSTCAGIIADISNVLIPHGFLYYSFALGIIFSLAMLNGHFFHKTMLVCYFFLIQNVTQFVLDRSLILVQESIELSTFSVSVWHMSNLILTKIVLIFVIIFMIKISSKSDMQLPMTFWAFMTIFNFMILFCVIYINDMETMNNLNSIKGVSAQLYLLLLSLFMYYLFSRLSKEYVENIKERLMRQQIDIQQKFFIEMNEVYKDLRRLKHEMKNHVLYMDTMLTNNDYVSLHNYFSKLHKFINNRDIKIITENYIVNAVLNQKYNYAVANGIHAEITANIPEQLKIDIMEFCTVVSNLFDNAIEECIDVENGKIDLEIKMIKQYLAIHISNSTKENVLESNPSLLTKKVDSENHGIGLWIVKDIVKKYDGIVQFISNGKVFEVKVMLKYIK